MSLIGIVSPVYASNLQDLSLIEDDPELWRKAYGFLSVCAYEVREYGDDDLDINLAILEEEERDYAEALGPPEETVLTRVECNGQVRTVRAQDRTRFLLTKPMIRIKMQ